MVKLPGLDDLKKMGTGLIDTAKSVKIGEMVDKVKTGIESVSVKKSPSEFVSDEMLKNIFQGIYTSLNELTQAQLAQVSVIKKIETQLAQLAKAVEANQINKEDGKPHE